MPQQYGIAANPQTESVPGTVIGYLDANGKFVPASAAFPIPTSTTTGVGGSATGTPSAVASGVGDVTILTANANRKGATVFNDDSNVLYLLLSAGTSSATNYTAQVPFNGYYEVPFGYVGVLKGTWAADGSGSARVTEFT